jgi:trans-aconitate 2-methyltransferase
MTRPHAGHRYTFGATDAARERLDLLARIFEPSSFAFLEAVVDAEPQLALDLGCGPGHTTALVRRATSARRVVGIDAASSFIEAAVARFGGAGVEFIVADVMSLPAEVTPADLIFARFLLAHLPDPPTRVAEWVAHLTPGGALAVEEVEDIVTDEPAFRSYLEMTRDLVASTGATLYAGPRLAGVESTAGAISSNVVELTVPASDAARMFSLNLDSLRDDPWVRRHRTGEQLARLNASLVELSSATAADDVTWRLRQVVLTTRPRTR